MSPFVQDFDARAPPPSCDPGVHARLQHVERQGAVQQHRVVERRTSNARRQPLLGAAAQLLQLQLADLVGQRLARPADVAVQLGLDVPGRQARSCR
jgi:hypothetical protein